MAASPKIAPVYPERNVLGELGEYVRRSGRNLETGARAALGFAGTGLGFEWRAMAENARANNAAIKRGADAFHKKLGGGTLTPDEEADMEGNPVLGFGTDAGPGGAAFALMHAGPGSRMAKLGKLRNAQKALQRGDMTPDQIREKYGWYQEPVSGDWKWEIDDSAARLVPEPDPTLGADQFRAKFPQGYQFVHKALVSAYPGLGNVTIGIHKRGEYGGSTASYFPNANHISLADDLPPDKALDAVIHEFQHGVQRLEGASPGTAPNTPEITKISDVRMKRMRTDAKAAIDAYDAAADAFFKAERARGNQRHPRLLEEDFQRANGRLTADYLEAQRTLQGLSDPWWRRSYEHDTYERALGETAARDAAERRALSPEDRRAVPPYKLGMMSAAKPIGDVSELFDLRAYLLGRWKP